ncbi:MAG: beta strand repeat-containing protein [Blastococcus sp.]
MLGLAVPATAVAATGIAYVQGTAFGTGTTVTSTQAKLTGAVAAGDLLVGWFSQYNATGNVQVSDNVNGAWTRAPASLPFGSTSGDNALYYVQNAQASAAGLTVTIGASAATYLQGTFSEYSGVATSGALDQSATGKGTGTAVTTAATASVTAGDLVYSALVTGGNPSSASPGSSLGVNFTARARNSTGSVFSEDITSSAAGAQVGTATLGASTNWIAGVAAFHPAAAGQPPAAPTGLTATSVTASQVVLSWTASTGTPAVTGYVVFRGGSQIGTSTTTGFTDSTVAASTTYSYTVAATNSAGTSSPSSPLSVTTPAAAASVAYVQGAAWTTGSRVASSSSPLAQPVRAGDLLVGWFGQYNVAGQVTVSDSVNGTWTRAPTSLAWQNDTGDIALYYVPSSKAAASGLTVTVSAGGAAYLEATLAEYSGVAAGGPLDQVSSARGVGTTTDSGPVTASSAGELVYSASLTGGNPGGVTSGTSQGVKFTPRASTGSGSAYEQDILNGAAGTQHGTSTLLTSTDWYAVAATFHAQPASSSGPPTAPSGLAATSVATSRVTLSWTPSSGGVAGYTVYSGGAPLGNVSPGSTTFIDTTVNASSSYSYTVAAFNLSGQYSAMSNAAAVTTPARSPVFVQGIATSPGSRLPSLTLTLSKPVSAGDLLVGWFGQYNAAGQVTVSDNVNGAWTRSSASETWSNGTGDIALFTVANSKAAPGGLSVTISASAPAYLQEAIADFSGVATTSPLDQAAVGYSTGTTVIGGPTAATPAGDLVIAAVITGGQPGNITPGSSLGIPYVVDVQNGSASADLEDILSGAAGPQSEHATLGTNGGGSYTVVAAFRPL